MGIDSHLVVGYGILVHMAHTNTNYKELCKTLFNYLNEYYTEDDEDCVSDGSWNIYQDGYCKAKHCPMIAIMHCDSFANGSMKTAGVGGFGVSFDSSMNISEIMKSEAHEIYDLLADMGCEVEKPNYVVYHYFA